MEITLCHLTDHKIQKLLEKITNEIIIVDNTVTNTV